ncbi:MAG: hemerythrin domain-containing protein [Betaproteobacteria bacterium]|nr:hemerythrin domain-containing protein [Betaproteobacteria bacterium]
MTSFRPYLSAEHTTCDEAFVDAENAVAAQDWSAANQAFPLFQSQMQRHFAREEEVLFPTFEARTGMSGGPTWVMRNEHQQMRGLMQDMAASLERQDRDGFLGQSETLLMLMRQHNMKEENILYPMAENALGDEGDALLDRMAAV